MKTYLLSVGLLFMVVTARSQTPKADFDFVVDYRCGWAVVDVENKSVDADSCFWDFDGRARFQYFNNSKIPLGNLGIDKFFTVSLIAQGNGLSDTITKFFDLKHTKALFEFTTSDSLGFAPLSVDFVNTSQEFNGDSLTYRWDFGDGSSSLLMNPSHTYTTPGEYYTSLIATTKSGCELQYSAEFIVKDTLQKDEFDFITSGCNEFLALRYDYDKHFEYKNDTLRIFGIYSANCCSQKTATLRNSGDTIFVRTFETGALCTCGCDYTFSINVPDIHRDSVIVSFDKETYNVKLLTSIVSIQDDPSFSITPNPIENEFILSCDKLTNKSSLAIYDLSGKVVYKAKSIYDKMLINCCHLKSGIYLLKVTIDNSNTKQQKIVINNAR